MACLIQGTLQAHPGSRAWERTPGPWHLIGGSEQLASPWCRSGYFACNDCNGLWFILSIPVNFAELKQHYLVHMGFLVSSV